MNPLLLVALVFLGNGAAPVPEKVIAETDLVKDFTVYSLIQKIGALNDMLDRVASDTSQPEERAAKSAKILRKKIGQLEHALEARKIALGWRPWYYWYYFTEPSSTF